MYEFNFGIEKKNPPTKTTHIVNANSYLKLDIVCGNNRLEELRLAYNPFRYIKSVLLIFAMAPNMRRVVTPNVTFIADRSCKELSISVEYEEAETVEKEFGMPVPTDKILYIPKYISSTSAHQRQLVHQTEGIVVN